MARDQTHEEDEQVVIAERAQNGCECQQQRADGDHRHQRAEHQAPASHLGELQHRHHDHQHRAHRDRGGPPGVLDFQRRGRDVGFLVGELVARINDQQQEGERGGDRHHVEECPHRRGGHADEGRHAHVLTAPERHHRPQHGEPQEQDRGQLVRPDEWLVKDIARDHAGEQDADLGHDQSRRRDLDQGPQRRLQPRWPSCVARKRGRGPPPRVRRLGYRPPFTRMFSIFVMPFTPAFQRFFPGCSRLRRRTWPSSPGRSWSCPARPGTRRYRRR